jgi:hypothetical protein
MEEKASFPCLQELDATLRNTSKLRFPASVLFPQDSFHAITAGHRSHSVRLLVGSVAGSYRHVRIEPRRFSIRFRTATSPG